MAASGHRRSKASADSARSSADGSNFAKASDYGCFSLPAQSIPAGGGWNCAIGAELDSVSPFPFDLAFLQLADHTPYLREHIVPNVWTTQHSTAYCLCSVLHGPEPSGNNSDDQPSRSTQDARHKSRASEIRSQKIADALAETGRSRKTQQALLSQRIVPNCLTA